MFQRGAEAEKKEVHLPCFRETCCKSGQPPSVGNVQHKRTWCLESGPADAHCCGDPQAIAGGSHAVTACKPDVAAPCLHTARSAQTSHHSSTFEMWPCGTQKYAPAHVLLGTRAATAERLLPELPGVRGWGAVMAAPLPPPECCPGMLSFSLPSPAVGLLAHCPLLPPSPQKRPPACLVSSPPADYPKQLAMKSLNQI